MATRNLYLVLGVPRTASGSEIHDAFRRMAKERHPDVAGEGSTAAFQDLAQAYAVLSNPRLRRRHDAALARAPRHRPRPPRPLAFARQAHPGHLSTLEALLTALGGARAPRSARASVTHLEVLLQPDQAARGCRVEMPLTARLECAGCDGGQAAWRAACPLCSGLGVVERSRVEVFDIPPGTSDGTWLEYRIEMGTADHGFDVDQPDHALVRLRVGVRSWDRPPEQKEMRS